MCCAVLCCAVLCCAVLCPLSSFTWTANCQHRLVLSHIDVDMRTVDEDEVQDVVLLLLDKRTVCTTL